MVNALFIKRSYTTLPLKKEKRPLSEAAAANCALSGPAAANAERTAFFDAYARQSFQQVRRQFLCTSPLPVGRKSGDRPSGKKFTFPRIFRKKEK